jgi:hypothetical protein
MKEEQLYSIKKPFLQFERRHPLVDGDHHPPVPTTTRTLGK